MITKSDIINALETHIDNNKFFTFYKKCISYINDEIKTHNIDKIKKNEYLLESIRILLCYNINDYHIYLYNTKKKNTTSYLLKLDDTTTHKLLYQLACISEHNNIISLADNITIPDVKFKKNNNLNYIYFIISKEKLSFKNQSFELNNLYNCLGLIFGIESLNYLKYQKLDRIINFIKKDKEALKIYEQINNYYINSNKLDWKEREMNIIFSGVIFSILGTTYTNDIDMIRIDNSLEYNSLSKVFSSYKNWNANIEMSVLAKDNKWFISDNNGIHVKKYLSTWFTTVWANLVGAENIYEILSNPMYHFNYMGVKFISINMNNIRLQMRSNINSITDLVMLKKINNYQFENFCIPNMTIRQGKLRIFDNNAIQYMVDQIVIKGKEFYNQTLTKQEISEFLIKCSTKNIDIYTGAITYDPDTSIIKKFHIQIKQSIYSKYCKYINNLLDIGTGKLTDVFFWNESNIKNVVGIEPSISSIKKAYKKLESIKHLRTNVTIIHGVGDTKWSLEDKYNKVLDKKYDVVMFSFTIHYMIHNIDTLIDNLKQVTKKGTKFIILCMDGTKIKEEFNKRKIIEVRNDEEPIFAISPYKDDHPDDILVYFKGAYGVANGSIETLVDIGKLISIFNKNNIKLIDKKNFLDYNMPAKFKMSPTQKRVSSYYMSMVFEMQ